jgi:hypothetical protein
MWLPDHAVITLHLLYKVYIDLGSSNNSQVLIKPLL